MAAKIIIPAAEDWEVISEFLSEVEEGAIVISPQALEQIKEDKNFDPGEIEAGYVEYDFGGEADTWIDTVWTSDHMAVDIMQRQYQEEQGLETNDNA